jgi:tetratricopeptide (TPR) repeat protein
MIAKARASLPLLILVLCLWAPGTLAQSGSVDLLARYSDEAQAALAQGRYSDAEAAFEKLRQLSPQTAEVHANLGVIYFKEKKFDEAVAALREALRLKPSLPKIDALLAMSLSELGKLHEALPGLQKAFRQSSDTETKRLAGLQLERAYTGLGQDDKAVEVALQLNHLFPKDPEVLYNTGRLFGNFAFVSMERLAQEAPDSIWRHEAAAEAYESQGANDLAIREFREVLARDPQHTGIHFRLGRTLLARSHASSSTEDAAQAVQEFQEELKLDPSNANAAYELAELHRNAGEFSEAATFFQQALKYYPDFEEAHLGLAAVWLSQQKPQLALAHLQKAIALNPHNEVAWYRLSQAQRALGNTGEQQKALAEFQRVRATKEKQQAATGEIFSRSEVTKQEVDSHND